MFELGSDTLTTPPHQRQEHGSGGRKGVTRGSGTKASASKVGGLLIVCTHNYG
jgi:hypothetical protein